MDWAAAVRHLDRRLEARPGRWQDIFARAEDLAESGLWREAGAGLAHLNEVVGEDAAISARIALLRLLDGDSEGYRSVCRKLSSPFPDGRDAYATFWASWAAVLAPPGIGEPAEAAEVVERAGKAAREFP